MKYSLFFVVTFFASFLSSGQNITNTEGLKVGRWTLSYDDGTSEGIYKIISRNKYDSVDEDWGMIRNVIFKKKRAMQYYSGGVYDTLISVQDGIWTWNDRSGNYEEKYWVDGVLQWAKYYDTSRELISREIHDYLSDTDYTVAYEHGRIVDSVLSWDVNDKSWYQHFYYPNGSLIFTKLRASLYANFICKTRDTSEFKFVPKQNLSLLKLGASSRTLSVYDRNFRRIKMPLRLVENDTFCFHVVFRPTPLDVEMEDTVFLETDVMGDQPYRLFIETDAAHIDRNSGDTSFTLSKSRDRFLIIKGMGTLNAVEIRNKNEVVYTEGLRKKLEVDISKFETGKYNLTIGGDALRIYNFLVDIVD